MADTLTFSTGKVFGFGEREAFVIKRGRERERDTHHRQTRLLCVCVCNEFSLPKNPFSTAEARSPPRTCGASHAFTFIVYHVSTIPRTTDSLRQRVEFCEARRKEVKIVAYLALVEPWPGLASSHSLNTAHSSNTFFLN